MKNEKPVFEKEEKNAELNGGREKLLKKRSREKNRIFWIKIKRAGTILFSKKEIYFLAKQLTDINYRNETIIDKIINKLQTIKMINILYDWCFIIHFKNKEYTFYFNKIPSSKETAENCIKPPAEHKKSDVLSAEEIERLLTALNNDKE